MKKPVKKTLFGVKLVLAPKAPVFTITKVVLK